MSVHETQSWGLDGPRRTEATKNKKRSTLAVTHNFTLLPLLYLSVPSVIKQMK